MTEEESVFDFPCRFPIKIMGEKDAGLEDFVAKVLESHLKDPASVDTAVRLSKNGTYISITATFTAYSKDELDQLYRTLNEHPQVKMIL